MKNSTFPHEDMVHSDSDHYANTVCSKAHACLLSFHNQRRMRKKATAAVKLSKPKQKSWPPKIEDGAAN